MKNIKLFNIILLGFINFAVSLITKLSLLSYRNYNLATVQKRFMVTLARPSETM